MTEALLAAAIRDRRVVLFAGAGLTRDADLPGWSGLVTFLADDLQAAGRLSAGLAIAVAALIAQNDLPAAMQVLMTQAPRSELAALIRARLTPSRTSDVVTAVSDWRPRGVITTNFDRETERIVPATGYRLSNSEAALKLIPTAVGASAPFIWKIHGDIDDELDPSDAKVASGGPFMVLSQSDFAVLVQGDRGRQLSHGLFSVLQTAHVVFLGYSFADPDLNVLLRWLTDNCQFAYRSWYVCLAGDRTPLPANVERLEPIRRWDELAPWIRSVTEIARRTPAHTTPVAVPPATPTRDTYLAISRYLTALESPETVERVLAAALFDELSAKAEFDKPWLNSRVAEMLGVGARLASALADALVRLLVEYSLVARTGDSIRISTGASSKLRSDAEASWAKERDEFFKSAHGRLPAGSGLLTAPTIDALEAALLDLCSELGESMAEWVSRGTGGAIGWPDFSDTLRRHLTGDEELRQADRLLRLILANPRDAEIPYLYRIIGATFLANTVRLNPVASAQLRDSLSQYELYLDANVLLPLIVREHPNHGIAQAVVEESIRAGVKLCVLTPILNEVSSHRDLARRDFRTLGGDNSQLAEVATVLGSRANVFLQGYLRAPAGGTIGTQPDWREYLGRYSDGSIVAAAAAFGIAVVTPDAGVTTGPLYASALTAIRDEWFRKLGHQREDVLNTHEATQVCHIYRRREQAPERRNHVWFLSNETVLQRVFAHDPSRWILPATFPYSAWVAFLDSRMPQLSQDPGAIVKAILRGRVEAFELPSPISLVRDRAFGDRVTSKEEEEALTFATSDLALMRRVEEAQRAVYRRGRGAGTTRQLAAVRQEAVAEISGALDAQIGRLRQELARARTRIAQLEATGSTSSWPERAGPARRPNRRTRHKTG